MQWLKEGDRNTKFFHRMASAHKNANFIRDIWIEDRHLEEEEEIKGGIVSFYKLLYSDDGEWHPRLDRVQFGLSQ